MEAGKLLALRNDIQTEKERLASGCFTPAVWVGLRSLLVAAVATSVVLILVYFEGAAALTGAVGVLGIRERLHGIDRRLDNPRGDSACRR